LRGLANSNPGFEIKLKTGLSFFFKYSKRALAYHKLLDIAFANLAI